MTDVVKDIWEDQVDDPDGAGLRIGCGEQSSENWHCMDSRDIDGVDLAHDMRKVPWPIYNNEYDVIMARDVLEHIPHHFSWFWPVKKERALVKCSHVLDWRKVSEHDILATYTQDPMVAIVEQMYRLSKPGAIWLLQFPVAGETFQHRDPTHARGIHPEFFLHWDPNDQLYGRSFDPREVSISDMWYTKEDYGLHQNWNMVVEVEK